ncbi:uncharacterized protein LOC6647959 [Drosophila willistoni]|uniref:uncharacterized protein LOC6647959 n=1 Tax=Drosophila willistoni TaxID=7260 RepID=UPI001F071D00|nr:uncharacterized protein LOC6647959 [Drosophila willistoni]
MARSSPVILLVLFFVKKIQGTTYEFLFDDQDIFNNCTNQPSNVIGLWQLFDNSEIRTLMDNDIINVSGNFTTLNNWAIEPTDRIMLRVNTYHWEVGNWQPTVFNLVSRDFCKVMYDRNQYWYNIWTKHITNVNEVKQNCINVPGTKYLLEPYDIHFVSNVSGPGIGGRYKFEMIFEAYDGLNKKRPTSICFMYTGEAVKQ